MATGPNPLVAPLVGWLAGLRFPVLFVIAATLFAVDLIVPDLIPFLDELMLGLSAALLASWRRRRDPEPGDSAGSSGPEVGPVDQG